jgi:hypothetical protein
MFGKPLINDNNVLHSELQFKPDSDGFRIEVNLVMTTEIKKAEIEVVEEVKEEKLPPKEYKHDATKAPVIEEKEYDFTIEIPDE